ncbi:MAG TPA: 50S ribosomal protein L6 [Patescibacteria group bacterium]|nr:50S ribosomal protein L6 [Patescibacteria group bacterium]
MSKIGRQAVEIPAGVTITITPEAITVKGPKGELTTPMMRGISVAIADGKAVVSRNNDLPAQRAAHGLIRSLMANMVIGVTNGFEKKLEMVGTGYRVALKGQGITLSVGYSHPVDVVPPKGITFAIEGNTKIKVTGIDKGLVGQTAANIHKVRPPEPYKGKGIRYEGEVVRRKAGKAAKTAGAK